MHFSTPYPSTLYDFPWKTPIHPPNPSSNMNFLIPQDKLVRSLTHFALPTAKVRTVSVRPPVPVACSLLVVVMTATVYCVL